MAKQKNTQIRIVLVLFFYLTGGLIAGIYTTNNPGQCKYISEHCRASVAVVDGEKQLSKFLEIRDALPELKAIIVWNISESSKIISDANANVSSQTSARIYHWNEFMEMGSSKTSEFKELDNEMNKRIKKIEAGNACTLIYTSGTTGPPKAVMLSHDNITWQGRAFMYHMTQLEKTKDHAFISYLPLSHIAAQLTDIHFPMALMAWYKDIPSVTVFFARPDALKGMTFCFVICLPEVYFDVTTLILL